MLRKNGSEPPSLPEKKEEKRDKNGGGELFACPMCRLFDETVWSDKDERCDPRDELLYQRHLEVAHGMLR
jgi:hypothetical protein